MSLAFVLCLAVVANDATSAIDFDTHIIPVLTKAGCNAGACHGAAAGRGGFHLSLWGSDPAADYESIVQALEGRRVNLARPETSLLLAKPTFQLDHGGEMALEPDGDGAQRLLAWIRAGAPRGPPRRLTEFAVSPSTQRCETLPSSVRLVAQARFDDGPTENVTRWTVFASSDPSAVEIDRENSVARVLRRGQHVVIARFLDRVVTLPLVAPFSDVAVNLANEPRANFIDEEILRTLELLRLPPSPPADDATFLRRARLDLSGRLPEPGEVESFLSDPAADKRAKMVDTLLASDAFADYWTLRFGRLLRLHALPNETEGVRAYANWLRSALDEGMGFDDVASALLTATGDSHEIGPANFGRMVNDAREHAELVGAAFLGVRLGCANCHNHPLDKWTQDDYHGLAAVFAKLERGRHVRLAARGGVTNLRTGEPAVPRIPGVRNLDCDGDQRAEVARWLTSSENRQFARSAVNRLWRAMFGRGLVEPPDNLADTNPPTHPVLLDRLADDFVQHGQDIRHTLRLIARSNAYARGGLVLEGNAKDDRFYSRALRRPLGPEVLADAIADVTGVPNLFEGFPSGTRAVTLVDPLVPSVALDVLGRCSRADDCGEQGSVGGRLSAQLHLLNGEFVNARLSDEHGRLRQLIGAGETDAQIVSEFYLRALCRPPTADELATWVSRLSVTSADDAGERVRRLEDFVWSLLNSRSFMENR